MTFYNRNGILYVSIKGLRKSTKLEYSKQNIKKFKSYFQDEEFFNNFNIKKSVPTVLQLCYDILDEKEQLLKYNSYRSYLCLINSKIKPYFKNSYVNEIKPIDIFNFYKIFEDSSTLNTCNAILKQAFEKAIILGYISTTPFIIKKRHIKTNYEINPFTFHEAKKIIDFAPGHIRNIIAVSFFTGMRTGEVLGLKWRNIDFQNYNIKIESQKTCGIECTPKTNSSNRTIDMIPQCEFYLKEQFKITSDREYLFYNRKNKTFHSSSALQYTWKRILKALNIPFRSIYQTRHSFASNMLSNGENALWVSQMLGHKSLDITLQKYSKYIKQNKERKTTYLDN